MYTSKWKWFEVCLYSSVPMILIAYAGFLIGMTTYPDLDIGHRIGMILASCVFSAMGVVCFIFYCRKLSNSLITE